MRASRPERAFVDSGGWIALVSPRDQHHTEAESLFREAAERRVRLHTSNLVIAEVHRFLLFQAGARAALNTLDHLVPSERLTIHFADAEHDAAAREWLHRFPNHPISYTDAVSFAVMDATGCQDVLGFDDDFAVAGFRLWRG